MLKLIIVLFICIIMIQGIAQSPRSTQAKSSVSLSKMTPNGNIDKSIYVLSDSIYVNGLEPKLDSINKSILNAQKLLAKKDNNFNASLYISLIINLILAYIAIRQYRIILQNEKSYLMGNSCVEIIDKNRSSEDTEDFLKNNSRFFLQLTNIGKSPITDIWIRIPDNLEFSVSSNQRDILKVFHIDEPMLPEERKIIFFDDKSLFGDNFKILNNIECELQVKFKSVKEKKYKTLAIKFSIKNQKQSMNYDYQLSVSHALSIENNELQPIKETHWNKL